MIIRWQTLREIQIEQLLKHPCYIRELRIYYSFPVNIGRYLNVILSPNNPQTAKGSNKELQSKSTPKVMFLKSTNNAAALLILLLCALSLRSRVSDNKSDTFFIEATCHFFFSYSECEAQSHNKSLMNIFNNNSQVQRQSSHCYIRDSTF